LLGERWSVDGEKVGNDGLEAMIWEKSFKGCKRGKTKKMKKVESFF
jgi:hypothetical protein